MNWEELKQRGSEHYKTSGGVEPIDLYRSAGMLRHFALGCIIKYSYRNADLSKPINLEDLKKVIHYADLLIASYEEKEKPSPRSAGFKGEYDEQHKPSPRPFGFYQWT